MKIDHIFIFTKPNEMSINRLIEAGFIEGIGRVHEGQGTANRKFYFENFFLEFIWVTNETEMQSESISPLGLWERANFEHNGYSRFGVCFENDDTTDKLFENAVSYQPAYFPQGKVIEILKHEKTPSLPMMFRLPFKGEMKHNQPVEHKNSVKRLTEVTFQHTDKLANKVIFDTIPKDVITFKEAEQTWLALCFDNVKQRKIITIEELNLSIQY